MEGEYILMCAADRGARVENACRVLSWGLIV